MKRFLSIVICASLLIAIMSVLPAFALQTGDMYARKVVSVVYDDSGSMKSDNRNCFASYAAQVFGSLMNERDLLNISFMKGADKDIVVNDLSAAKRDALINQIYEATKKSDSETPYGTVTRALEYLLENGMREKGKRTDDTRYWLVVTTDGEMTDAPGIFNKKVQRGVLAERLKKMLDTYDNLSIIFLSINEEEYDMTDVSDKSVAALVNTPGFYSEFVRSSAEVVSSLERFSNYITGRYKANSSNIKIDGNKVTFTMGKEEPTVKTLSVLLQNTSAVLRRAVCENTELTPYMTSSIRSLNTAVIGNGACITLSAGGDAPIPSGQIVLEFSGNITPDNISLLCEPALDIRLKAERTGSDGKVSVLSPDSLGDVLNIGDDIKLSYEIIDKYTDKKVESGFFGEINESFILNGKQISGSDGIHIDKGTTDIKITLKMLNDTYIISKNISFYIDEVTYTADASEGLTAGYVELSSGYGKSVSFTVFRNTANDKIVITDDEETLFTIKAEGNGAALPGKTEYLGKGVFVFTSGGSGIGIGDYNVGIYKDDEKLASAVICVTDDTPVVTLAEGSGSSEKTVHKFKLAHNESYVTFSVMADGVPYTRDELESLIKSDAFSVTADRGWAGKRLSFTVDTADENGLAVIRVLPTTEKSEGWTGYWSVLGLRDGKMNIKISVGGISCESALTVYGDALWYLHFITATVFIILFAALTAWTVIKFIRRVPFKKGYLIYGSVRDGDTVKVSGLYKIPLLTFARKIDIFSPLFRSPFFSLKPYHMNTNVLGMKICAGDERDESRSMNQTTVYLKNDITPSDVESGRKADKDRYFVINNRTKAEQIKATLDVGRSSQTFAGNWLFTYGNQDPVFKCDNTRRRDCYFDLDPSRIVLVRSGRNNYNLFIFTEI